MRELDWIKLEECLSWWVILSKEVEWVKSLEISSWGKQGKSLPPSRGERFIREPLRSSKLPRDWISTSWTQGKVFEWEAFGSFELPQYWIKVCLLIEMLKESIKIRSRGDLNTYMGPRWLFAILSQVEAMAITQHVFTLVLFMSSMSSSSFLSREVWGIWGTTINYLLEPFKWRKVVWAPLDGQ